MKRGLKILLAVVLVLVLAAGGFLAWMNRMAVRDYVWKDRKESFELFYRELLHIEDVYRGKLTARDDLELVWSDEFDGDALDLDSWVYDVGANRWGNEELEYYTEGENLEVKDGSLVITARKEEYEGAQYTSSRIKTKEKVSFQKGRIEARMKLPSGQGIWPAFWMMGRVGSWPQCGELDIMEAINDCSIDYGNIHWGVETDEGYTVNGHANMADGDHVGIDQPEDWHVYALEWDAQEFRWYRDDKCFFTFEYDKEVEGHDAFEDPFYLILNVAVGGNWTGKPDDSIFPQSMYVDYVRVYQTAR